QRAIGGVFQRPAHEGILDDLVFPRSVTNRPSQAGHLSHAQAAIFRNNGHLRRFEFFVDSRHALGLLTRTRTNPFPFRHALLPISIRKRTLSLKKLRSHAAMART